MTKPTGYDWVDFYSEFAGALLTFKNNRDELIKIIKEVYEEIDIKLPTLEEDNQIVDIDPFTVFGLFNKQITQENRIKIISKFAEKLKIKADIPRSFDSIPILNNMNATYYRFRNQRGRDDIDNLWELYESALLYSNNKTRENKDRLEKYFDIVINQWGIGNSKLTMGLYWIAPNTFLNLDSRSQWYIYESGNIDDDFVDKLPEPEEKITADSYFKIAEKLSEYVADKDSKSNNLLDLSHNAWKKSTEENKKTKDRIQDEVEKGLGDQDVKTVNYWIYSPGENAYKWDEFYKEGIMGIGWEELGNLKRYSTKGDIVKKLQEVNNTKSSYTNTSLAAWEFANEMEKGDIVFVKKGRDKVIGRGIVESAYIYDEKRKDYYKNIRKIQWTDNGEWEHPGSAALKTLTDITRYTEYVEDLNEIFEVDKIEEAVYPKYDEDILFEEVFIGEEDYYTLKLLLKNKKNIILQGAPGVGKTFIAKRLAYSLIGEKNQDQVEMVQFHQSYSYEDFIESFRPSKDGKGFEIKKGAFYRFCKKASQDLENDYYFIIDEINRGNLSKIFGELFMLIEKDKRGNNLQLLYSDEKFNVPKNVYIIGMMNTADRSLAMLDYALRRRFAFYTLEPVFENEGFINYQKDLNDPKFDSLIDCIIDLNREIEEDDSLGSGFKIGHSYFTNIKSTDQGELEMIIEYEIIPLIKEYWFDETSRLEE